MGFSKPPGVPCPTNNPHCQGLPESVSIQSDFLTIILILAIFGYVFFIFKSKPKELTTEEKKRKFKTEVILDFNAGQMYI